MRWRCWSRRQQYNNRSPGSNLLLTAEQSSSPSVEQSQGCAPLLCWEGLAAGGPPLLEVLFLGKVVAGRVAVGTSRGSREAMWILATSATKEVSRWVAG